MRENTESNLVCMYKDNNKSSNKRHRDTHNKIHKDACGIQNRKVDHKCYKQVISKI